MNIRALKSLQQGYRKEEVLLSLSLSPLSLPLSSLSFFLYPQTVIAEIKRITCDSYFLLAVLTPFIATGQDRTWFPLDSVPTL